MSAPPGWFELRPGMLLTDGSRVVRAHPNPGVFNLRAVHPDGTLSELRAPLRVVEDDPATLGCLTARVRELREEPTFRPSHGYSFELHAWCWTFRWDGKDYYRSTEWAALMAAGDAAWARRGGAS